MLRGRIIPIPADRVGATPTDRCQTQIAARVRIGDYRVIDRIQRIPARRTVSIALAGNKSRTPPLLSTTCRS